MRVRSISVVWHLIRETGRRWSENDGNLLAASMAYYAAFSFFPLLLVMISGLGFALQFSSNAQDREKQLLQVVSQQIAPALADQIGVILAGVRINASFSGPIGLGVLLLAAIAMFNQLDYAFDRLWRIAVVVGQHLANSAPDHRIPLHSFSDPVRLGLLLISALLIGMALSAFHQWADDRWQHLDSSWESIEFLVGLAFHTIVFTVLYKMLPKAKVRWKHALAGGMWVAVIWEIGRLAMSYIIAGKNYTPYGVVGSFIAIMVWVYYASTLTFLGTQFVEVLENPNELPKAGCK